MLSLTTDLILDIQKRIQREPKRAIMLTIFRVKDSFLHHSITPLPTDKRVGCHQEKLKPEKGWLSGVTHLLLGLPSPCSLSVHQRQYGGVKCSRECVGSLLLHSMIKQ